MTPEAAPELRQRLAALRLEGDERVVVGGAPALRDGMTVHVAGAAAS